MTTKKTLDNWLANQSICITGARGGLGRRLTRWLISGGVKRLIAFDLKPIQEGEREDSSPRLEHRVGSILEPNDLDSVLQGVTVVFHLAALVNNMSSQKEIFRYFEANAFGTAQVLEACRRAGIQKAIYTSTSYVYGIPRQFPVQEDHPTFPLSAYAASKLAGEAAVQGYAIDCEMSCVIARLANMYGAAFSPDTVVGRAVQQAAMGGPIQLRNLNAVRDFIYTEDVVEALIRLAAVNPANERCPIVNVASGRGVSVQEVAEILTRLATEIGFNRPEVIDEGHAKEEKMPGLILDNHRLGDLTGWVPQVTLERGLRLALREFREKRLND
jgi:nucleoside-diphosphate-sugar epimerase